jgi:cytochrome P450
MYFAELVAARRRDPRDDMISVLALAEDEGDRLDEMLRFDSTLHVSGRAVTTPVEIGDAQLEPGDAVSLVIGAANRDPAVFPDPDRFDVARENAERHSGFGFGVQHCLGHAPARAEGEVAVAALLERLPGLHLVEEDPPHDGWYNLRGLEPLPVEWAA